MLRQQTDQPKKGGTIYVRRWEDLALEIMTYVSAHDN